LGFDPTNRPGKLVGKELNKNGVRELLAVIGAGPFIFFLLPEDLVEARRRGLIVEDLSVLARDLEGFGDEIGIFSDNSANIELEPGILKQEGSLHITKHLLDLLDGVGLGQLYKGISD